MRSTGSLLAATLALLVTILVAGCGGSARPAASVSSTRDPTPAATATTSPTATAVPANPFDFSGNVDNVVDAQGYSYRVVYSLASDGPVVETTDEPPGFASITQKARVTLELTSTTSGDRVAPGFENFIFEFWYASDRPLCKLFKADWHRAYGNSTGRIDGTHYCIVKAATAGTIVGMMNDPDSENATPYQGYRPNVPLQYLTDEDGDEVNLSLGHLSEKHVPELLEDVQSGPDRIYLWVDEDDDALPLKQPSDCPTDRSLIAAKPFACPQVKG